MIDQNTAQGVLLVKQNQISPSKLKETHLGGGQIQVAQNRSQPTDEGQEVGHNSNSASYQGGDYSQMMMNSFDRQNLTAQMQKGDFKSTLSNNSNYDSGSYPNPGDPEFDQGGFTNFFGTSEMNFQKQNSFQNQPFGGAMISKQQMKYHKNASTNRGDSNQNRFMDMLKINKLHQMHMQNQSSYQTGAPLLSPHVNNVGQQPVGIMLSAHSKKSGTGPQGFTMRSLKSQNSNGTQNTNRADSVQKSPHMSDVQDPYAYFNMHQQQTTPVVQGQHSVKVSVASVNSQQMKIKNLSKDNNDGVKSCRPNLYGKQQFMISQRNAAIANAQLNKEAASPTQEPALAKSDNTRQNQFQSPHSGSPFVLNQNQIQFSQAIDGKMVPNGAQGMHHGNNSMHYYQNTTVNPLDKKNSAKGIFGFLGSAGSGSRGSNFNSSTSTFPAAPVQKLSEVKNPQKLMSFRFVNRMATKISEIATFKNLQELDLSGNLLQDTVKELCCLSFLKKLSLCNNKITDMWLLPSSIEILNLSHNNIKSLTEETCRKLKNITTIDISFNKLETLSNFDLMTRMKRLLVKNNFIRSLEPIQMSQNIFEIDLEGNAIDSYKDFLQFIKDKNDLIIVNLHLNPLMVEVTTIEKFNEDLIQNAPELVTQKTEQEIRDMKLLLGFEETKQHLESSKGGEESQRYNFHLIEELAQSMSFLNKGILYRNKRVYNKLKQISLKTKRSASNYSNSSHSFLTAGAKGHSAKLTPPSGAHNGLNRSSNPVQNKSNLNKSAGFSPIVSIKSQRYEDVEAIYDNIVEQEELKRLKQKKIMAKKRKEHKKLMVSQLENSTPGFDMDSEQGSSEEFSSNELEDSDLDMDDTLDLMEPREDFDDDDSSCIMDEGQETSQLLEFGAYQVEEEGMGQTITSDLDGDLHSYKNYAEPDDHEYLNGSTAGFGKKLREINREINQEQKEGSILGSKQKSLQKDLKQRKDPTTIKIKNKFDLNLDGIKRDQAKVHQSDLKINVHNHENQHEGVTVLNFKKQIQTAKNSDESNKQKDAKDTYNMDKDPKQTLDQSFSLQNMVQEAPSHEVESLMMNNKISQPEKHHGMQNSKSQNIQSQADQSVNQSLLNESLVSGTQTSKKTIVPNFKLDLSKCKQDEEDFMGFGEDEFSLQSEIQLQSIQLNEKDLDLMNIAVAKDSYRENEKLQPKILSKTKKEENKSVRNIAQKSPQKSEVNKTERVEKSKPMPTGCQSCHKLQSKLDTLEKAYSDDLKKLKLQIAHYQQALIKTKNFLNLPGQIDFNFPQKVKSKNLNIINFSDKVHLVFRRLYADLQKQRIEYDQLNFAYKQVNSKFTHLQNSNREYKDGHKPLSIKNITSKASIDFTDSGTPEVPVQRAIIQQVNNHNGMVIKKLELEKAQQLIHSAKAHGQQVPKIQGKGVLHIKMNEINKPNCESMSSSDDRDAQDEHLKVLKQKPAAKTMRNFPLSAADSSNQPPRVDHQYEANTFSSQYSLSNNQTANHGGRIEEGAKIQQLKIAALASTSRSLGKGGQKKDHASGDLHQKGYQKSVGKKQKSKDGLQKSLEQIKQESSQLTNYKTSRIPTSTAKYLGEASLDDEKEKTMQQHITDCSNLLLDNAPNQEFYNINDQNQSLNVFSNNLLANSTSNSAQIHTEKRKQKLTGQQMQLQVPVAQHSHYQTQRKAVKSSQSNSGVASVRPASRENKTQRLQIQRQQLLNKSGVVNASQLQNTYDQQDLRGQSVNITLGLTSNNESTSGHNQKRPQSVAEGGRKFQKIQQTSTSFTNSQFKGSSTNKKKAKSKSKTKHLPADRQSAMREMAKFLKNNQVKFNHSRVEQSVNNLSVNIQNIKSIRDSKMKYNTVVKPGTSQQVSKQNSAISRIPDDLNRQTSKMRVTNIEEYNPVEPQTAEPLLDDLMEMGAVVHSATGRRTTFADSHPSTNLTKQRRRGSSRSSQMVSSTIQGAPRKEPKMAELMLDSVKQRNQSMGNE